MFGMIFVRVDTGRTVAVEYLGLVDCRKANHRFKRQTGQKSRIRHSSEEEVACR